MIQPTTIPISGSSHQMPNQWSMIATGRPSRKPKTKPKVTISRSSRRPTSRKIETTRPGCCRKCSITMIFGSSSWSMCWPISWVMLRTTVGSCASTLAIDRLLAPGREVAPQPRVLAAHDLVDQLRQVRAEHVDDVLGDLLGLELLVEVLRRTDLGDHLVDGDAAHLGGARGHDALPADAALEQPRDLLHLARQHPGQLLEPGHRDAVEPLRVEQHPQPGPVDQPADHPGEDRDGEDVQPARRVDVREEPVDLERRHHAVLTSSPSRTENVPAGRVTPPDGPGERGGGLALTHRHRFAGANPPQQTG